MVAASLDIPASRPGAVVSRKPSLDLRLYLLWALFWGFMISVALLDYFRGNGHQWWQPLLWEGSSAVGATIWLVLQRRVAPRYSAYLHEPLRWFWLHLKWLPLIAVTFITFIYSVRHGVYALLGQRYQHEGWTNVFVYESIKVVLYTGLWLSGIFAFDSYAQWQAQRRRLLALQKSLAEAQLAQLRAKLRPHFFFNVLNTISALMHVDVERADRLLMHLGSFLRSSLTLAEQELVPLHEELRLLELYALIMQERYADRVTLEQRIDPRAMNLPVPALLGQPLLENAFKHGVERCRGQAPVRIEIIVDIADGDLLLCIANTGRIQEPSDEDGLGLSHCRERIKVIYDEAGSLQLTEAEGVVSATIRIPCPLPAA